MYARRGATEVLIQGYGSCVVSDGAPPRQNSFGRPEPGTHVYDPRREQPGDVQWSHVGVRSALPQSVSG